MKPHIEDLSLNISNYCLGFCKYCQLHNPKFWGLRNEMSLVDLNNLFHDPLLKNLKTIHVTGGSPFLSPKMLGLVDILAETHPDVPVNSPISGLYPYLMKNLARRIKRKLPQWRYNLAVEGPDGNIHEMIRGKNTWNPAMLTCTFLKELGCNVRWNMTVYPENYNYITETYYFAKDNGMELYVNFGRFSRRFGHERNGVYPIPLLPLINFVDEIEKQLLEIGWFKRRPLNLQKWKLQRALWLGQDVEWTCLMGERSIDVDPYGTVYACLMYPQKGRLGNIKSDSLSNIFNYPHIEQTLKNIRNGVCQPCPFTCALKIKDFTIDGKTCKGVNI